MTPEELVKLGYKKTVWNGGLFTEYWKSLYPKGTRYQSECRVGIRFGERKDQPFVVYLFGRSSMFPAQGAETVEDVETLYRLFALRR